MANSLLVYKHPELVKAEYTLTIHEQRLFDFIIGKLDTQQSLSESVIYDIDVSDYARSYALDVSQAFRDIKDSLSALMKDTYSFPTHKLFPNAGKKDITVANWLQHITYNNEKKTVEAQFTAITAKLVSELDRKTGFLKFDLRNKRHITSFYQSRLYELFKNWEKAGIFWIKIEDLRKILDLDEKSKRYKHIKGDILFPAIESINKTTDIFVSLKEEEKVMRKVVKLTFEVRKGETGRIGPE